MIGVCSFGDTGSGAFIDLLKEYNNTKVIDKREFVLTYFPDGFEDLEFHLIKQKAKFYSSDIALMKFKKYTDSICHNSKSFYYKLTDGHFNEIIDEYINSLSQIQYNGRWMFDDYIFDSNYKKLKYAINKNIDILEHKSLRKMYFSLDPENFYDKTKETLEKIYNYHNSTKDIVLDQPFPATNPENSMRLYGGDCKAIIVYRDPRDLYLSLKKYLPKLLRFIPKDDVNKFIRFYKYQYRYHYERKDIMYVNFEDLVFNYEETVNKIEEFCGFYSKNHVDKNKYFNPKISLKNTKLFMKNHKYDEDIKIIEKEMSEYLYDFSKYDEIDYSEDVF